MYKLNQNGITRLTDNAFIPNDPANTDWQAFLAWAAEGNTPQPQYDLAGTKANKSAEMAAACKAAISAGFTSTALGSAYHYPAEDRDQANLNGCVTQSYYPGNPAGWTISFYCEDANGAWTKRPHTAAQIQQVGSDAINAIQAALDKDDSLQQQIQAATTVDAVNAVTW